MTSGSSSKLSGRSTASDEEGKAAGEIEELFRCKRLTPADCDGPTDAPTDAVVDGSSKSEGSAAPSDEGAKASAVIEERLLCKGLLPLLLAMGQH